MTDRSLIEYEHGGPDVVTNQFKTEDHLTTAFGLAALMQNGFPPHGTILNPHTFTTSTISTKPTTSELFKLFFFFSSSKLLFYICKTRLV